jgi:hypothetical protein
MIGAWQTPPALEFSLQAAAMDILADSRLEAGVSPLRCRKTMRTQRAG